MKRDILHPEVTDIGVAIVPETNELNQVHWFVYLINLKHHAIQNVMVSASGYGEIAGRKKETTTLRFFLDELAARSFHKLESIQEEAFQLTNQYWVSYYERDQIHDKKYIFVPESISERNQVMLPLLNCRGIIIR